MLCGVFPVRQILFARRPFLVAVAICVSGLHGSRLTSARRLATHVEDLSDNFDGSVSEVHGHDWHAERMQENASAVSGGALLQKAMIDPNEASKAQDVWIARVPCSSDLMLTRHGHADAPGGSDATGTTKEVCANGDTPSLQMPDKLRQVSGESRQSMDSAGVERKLKLLKEFPHQLQQILESLGQLHARLMEVYRIEGIQADDALSCTSEAPNQIGAVTARKPHFAASLTLPALEVKKNPSLRETIGAGGWRKGRRIPSNSSRAVVLPQSQESAEPRDQRSFDSCGAPQSLTGATQLRRPKARASTLSNLALAVNSQRPGKTNLPPIPASPDGTRSHPLCRTAADMRDREHEPFQPFQVRETFLSGASRTSPSSAGGKGGHSSDVVKTDSVDEPKFRRVKSRDSVTSAETVMALPPSRVSCGTIANFLEGAEQHRWSSHSHHRFILPPTSSLRHVWDAFLIVGIIFTAIALPIEMIYFRAEEGGVIMTMLHTIDFVWIVDILFNFRTAFISAGRIVSDPAIIAMRYAKSWLVPDLITAWPLVLSPTAHPWCEVFWFLKLLRLLRLAQLFAKIEHEFRHISLLPVRVACSLFLTSHIMSCFWQAAQRWDDFAEVGVSWTDVYVRDLYWVLMTVTTVGYGDVIPQDTASRMYTIFVMLTAPLYSGLIVSAISHAMRSFFDDQIEHRVSEVTTFMSRHSVPVELQRRVQHNLRYHLHQQNRIEPELFEALSPAVQRELSVALLGSTIRQFPLFRDAQHTFVADLAQQHTMVQCSPGDIIAEEGQLKQELVFVIHGRLHLQHMGAGDSEESFVETEITAGAWFGEACLFEDDAVHTDTIVASAESELAAFRGREYTRIVREYPRLWQRHRYLAQSLKEGKVTIDSLAYKKPVVSSKKESQGPFWTFWTMWSNKKRVADSEEWTSIR